MGRQSHPPLRYLQQDYPLVRVRHRLGGGQTFQCLVAIFLVGPHVPSEHDASPQRRTSPLVPGSDCPSWSLFSQLLQSILDLGQFVEPGLDLLQQKPFFGRFRLCRPTAGVVGASSQFVSAGHGNVSLSPANMDRTLEKRFGPALRSELKSERSA